MRSVSIAFLSILCAALVSPASADNDKGKGNSHGGPKAGKHDNDRGRGDNDDRGNSVVMPYQQIVIVDRDRNAVRTYYRTEYAAGRCPPGLAKKNNGCLPPGQAKKRYVVGQRLPRTIVYQPAPTILVQRLTPAPVGYQYAVVDGDVVMLGTATRLVVDAIRHLVN